MSYLCAGECRSRRRTRLPRPWSVIRCAGPAIVYCIATTSETVPIWVNLRLRLSERLHRALGRQPITGLSLCIRTVIVTFGDQNETVVCVPRRRRRYRPQPLYLVSIGEVIRGVASPIGLGAGDERIALCRRRYASGSRPRSPCTASQYRRREPCPKTVMSVRTATAGTRVNVTRNSGSTVTASSLRLALANPDKVFTSQSQVPVIGQPGCLKDDDHTVLLSAQCSMVPSVRMLMDELTGDHTGRKPKRRTG